MIHNFLVNMYDIIFVASMSVLTLVLTACVIVRLVSYTKKQICKDKLKEVEE